MSTATLTRFAPAERASKEEILNQRKTVMNEAMFRLLLDAIPDGVLLLNKHRQIIYANRQIVELIALESDDGLLGLRPGEAFSCIHACEEPGGCGTAEACCTCGAVMAILESQKLGHSRNICRLSTTTNRGENALEFRVWSTALTVGDIEFLVFSFTDISHENRRRVLERIFFHDILNTAGGLKGFAELMKGEVSNDFRELADSVYVISDRLIQEILSFKDLSAAEAGELELSPAPVETTYFLRDMSVRFQEHHVARDRHIVIDQQAESVEFVTDPTILGRILANLVKNALEASCPGETVKMSCRKQGANVEFIVNNPAVMPRDVQLQIFSRSFSTKGKGRGIGTYSVKLLTERYLKGRVCFTSEEGKGTVFRVVCPLELF